MSETDDIYEYLHGVIHKIEGWLWDFAAVMTMRLLNFQERQNIRGPLLEIGVLRGRYFSMLIRSASRTGDRAVGIDIFQWMTEDRVRQDLSEALPRGSVYELVAKSSSSFTPYSLLALLGEAPRFISIDGSHDCEDVMWDLRNAEAILASDGIVALDDFMNPIAIGVNDGVHRFYATPRGIVPVAHLSNKLFLCRPHMASTYKKAIEEFVDEDPRDPAAQGFIERRERAGRDAVEQPLWGHKLLIF